MAEAPQPPTQPSQSTHASEEHPFFAARPPATDFITYLTIIEYNLSEDSLPVLFEVLQDEELTQNIGWDLVHLLLPYLPASEECLQLIARKGNAREVILKVTEALQVLEFDEAREDASDEGEDVHDTEGPSSAVKETESSAANTAESPVVVKFEVLLDILTQLHRRLKTKYPSRFLATSLQAVLAAYNRATSHRNELTLATVKLVKTLSGTKRPHLPPRTPSGNLLRRTSSHLLSDLEAQGDPPSADESTLSNRLLQSFLTHVLEDYILTLNSNDDVPGLAWSSRLMEKYSPAQIVPGKATYGTRFASEEDLASRSEIVGQLVALAQDLGIQNAELVSTLKDPEATRESVPGADDELPNSAADIPLSKTGSLLLWTARTVKQELYSNTNEEDAPSISIFPDHATVLENFVGVLGQQTIGLEPEALLDTVLALGLIDLSKNVIGEPTDDEAFAKYLQTTSLISANTPSPSLRYQAHYLTTTILRSHPSDLVRLTFIRDTLEHCPYENLKASAVTWLKGETLEANAQAHPIAQSASHSEPASNSTRSTTRDDDDPSIFSTPIALSTTAPYLFPDLTQSYRSAVDISESFMQFRQDLGFFLASLNFYFLLLTAKQLHDVLDIKGLHERSGMADHFLAPLREVIVKFRESLKEKGELYIAEGGKGDGVDGAMGELALLEYVLGKVDRAIVTL